jgi:hypothetical protein
MKSSLAALWLCSALGIAPLHAASFYLDADKGSDAAAGNAAEPWKSFARAQKTLKPGDTLFCTGKLGVISMTHDMSAGTETQWISYEKWPEHPQPHISALVFDGKPRDWFLRFKGILFSPGEVDSASYSENNAVYLQGGSHLTFEDCDIEGAQLAIPPGVIDPALGFSPYTPMSPFPPPALTAGSPGDASHITITKCRIRKCCIGIFAGRNPSYKDKLVRKWTITDNDIDDATEDGLRMGAGGGSDSLVARNFIHNQNVYRQPFNWAGKESSPGVWEKHKWGKVTQEGTGSSGVFYQMLPVADGRQRIYILADDKNHLPARNTTAKWVLDADPSVFFEPRDEAGKPVTGDSAHTDSIAVMGPTENVVFEQNTIEVSPYGGAAIKLENIKGHPTNFIFQNNLIYALPYHPSNKGAALINLAGGSNVVFRHNTIFAGVDAPLARTLRFNDLAGEGFDGIFFYNNIIGGGGMSNRDAVGVAVSDYNLWLSQPKPAFKSGPHDVILPGRSTYAAAKFFDPRTGNFRLDPASPARNIGSSAHTHTVPLDFDGNTRVGPPDAGAFEEQTP